MNDSHSTTSNRVVLASPTPSRSWNNQTAEQNIHHMMIPNQMNFLLLIKTKSETGRVVVLVVIAAIVAIVLVVATINTVPIVLGMVDRMTINPPMIRLVNPNNHMP